jgi:Glycosyl transferases group 1
MRILARTPLSPYTGYGNDGLGMLQALMDANCHVMLDPVTPSPPWPARVAQLMTHSVDPPFDLYLCHADPGNVACSKGIRKNSTLTLAWTMWEYETLENMEPKGLVKLRKTLPFFDVFVAYDEPTEMSINHFMDAQEFTEEERPLVIRQTGGYVPGDWQLPEGTSMSREWEQGKPFRFCMVGQLSQRKDPFVAIQAFQELKEDPTIEFEDAELHLKTNIPGLHPILEEHTPKLKVHYVTWPQDVLRAFMANCNVMLAPSRGEGKNMPALEFQTLGGVVIATDWGGHRSWLSSEYAYPLEYTMGHEPGLPDCRSARASKEHLKALMLHVYRNRTEAKLKGELAARTIPKMQPWPWVLEGLMMQLSLHPGAPHEIADLYFRAARSAHARAGGRSPVPQ